MKTIALIATLVCFSLGTVSCALDAADEADEQVGQQSEELSILPKACWLPYLPSITSMCANEDFVLGHTPECNLVCVPQTAIDKSCNCKPVRFRYCKPGNPNEPTICIALYGNEVPDDGYTLTAIRYWCDQTGICPAGYWRPIYPL